MNCAFKGIFSTPSDVEAAYYALRDKQLVYDLETSDLSNADQEAPAAQIAYASEGPTMLLAPGNELFPLSMGISDSRVAMTPLLDKQEEAPTSDACYLYGHCRKRDIDAVSACLKRYGASSVMTSAINRPIHLHH